MVGAAAPRSRGGAKGTDPAYRGARPFTASQQRRGGGGGGGRSGPSRAWSPKPRPAAHPRVSADDRMTQPIQHVVPLDLSFGNFEFQEMKSLGKRGGGVRELSSLLRHARRKAATHADMLHTRQGAEMRSEDLLSAAMQRAAGVKVKDDPHRIAKALAKRRSKKRQSAKRWATRIKHLEDSVENVVKERSAEKQLMKARKEAKVRAKEKKRDASSGRGGGGRGGGGAAAAATKKSSKKQSTSTGKKKAPPQQRRGNSSGGKKRR